MKKYSIEIKWGLLFAIMSLLWMWFEYLSGWHSEHIDKQEMYTNFFAIPAIALYVIALLDKRKNYYNGQMTYKQGFICGLIITLVVTVLSPLTQIITSKIITPEFFQNAIQYAVKIGRMTQIEAENFFNLKNYILMGFIGALGMGILTSAVVAIFTRKTIKS
ncbi:MAG: DUF4199 domain-containing protein [Bacteroidales bacterium]